MSSAYCVSRIFSSCMLFLFLSNCYIALLSLNYLFYWPLLEWWIDWFKSMVRWVHNVLESWCLLSFPYISLCKSSIHMPCLDSLRCITQLDWLLKANCILISVYLFDCFIDSSDIVFMWPSYFVPFQGLFQSTIKEPQTGNVHYPCRVPFLRCPNTERPHRLRQAHVHVLPCLRANHHDETRNQITTKWGLTNSTTSWLILFFRVFRVHKKFKGSWTAGADFHKTLCKLCHFCL